MSYKIVNGHTLSRDNQLKIDPSSENQYFIFEREFNVLAAEGWEFAAVLGDFCFLFKKGEDSAP